jgi:hypothetical protein
MQKMQKSVFLVTPSDAESDCIWDRDLDLL